MEFKENLSWQKGTHRIAFGIDDEHMKTKVAPWDYCDPGCDYDYSPEFIQGALGKFASVLFPNLPTTITSNQDLLNLPILNLPSSLYSGTGGAMGASPVSTSTVKAGPTSGSIPTSRTPGRSARISR